MAVAAAVALIALSSDAGAQEFVFEFGGPALDEPARLGSAASSIAVDADGNPWVADPANNRIVKYDYSGDLVAEFKSLGDVPVKTPSGIETDDKGFLYVAQGFSEPRIAKITAGGRLVQRISLTQAGGSPLYPAKIAVDGSGRIYASDGVNSVQAYTAAGVRRGEIRFPGDWGVKDVAVAGGEVFVSFRTAVANREGIRRYSPDLRLLKTIGPLDGVSFGEVAVDPGGRVNVADSSNAVVRRFDRAGSAIDTIGTRGIDKGQMNGPSGLAIDCRGNIYVLDGAARYDKGDVRRAGSKGLKYDVGGPPPPCAARPLPAGAIDTQVNDVEVTQAVQPSLSYTAGSSGAGFRRRAYGSSNTGPSGEVRLKALLPTVVRVYANLHAGPAGGIANVPATLEGIADGRSLGTIQPIGVPALLRVGNTAVAGALRTNPSAVYSFLVPEDWTTKGPIDLIARVNPARLGCDRTCEGRSTFRLTDVPFGTIRVATIAPIALTDAGVRPVDDPRTAFRTAQNLTPLLLRVQGWRTQAEVGDLLHADSVTVKNCFIGIWPCSSETYARGTDEYRSALQGELRDRLSDAVDEADINVGCSEIPIGLVSGANGQLPGATWADFQGLNPCALVYATVVRPITAVAHELQHAFSRRHAGQDCDGTRPGDDQEGEQWPPDNRGLLAGVGLNTAQRSGSRGPFQIVAPGVGGFPAELFDLMSYCPDTLPPGVTMESDHWISPRGWDELSAWRVSSTAGKRRALARQAGERLLRVTGIQLPNGALAITGVTPTTVAERGDPASLYVLEARDAKRNVLASQHVATIRGTEGRGKSIIGTVPAPQGTMQVFLRRGTEIGTVREGSLNEPKVTVLAPRQGARISAKTLVVRWTASDPDGGALIASVEYSANGGKRWRGIYVGPSSGRAVLLRSMLAGSSRARVRVRIHDGFNATVSRSKTFTVLPSPPQPLITDPAGAVTIRADSSLELRGGAIQEGRLLTPKVLRWFDGRRPLGRGRAVTVSGLRPGRRTISLLALSKGLTGRTTVTVKVRAVKPAFLRLDAPTKLSRRARSVRLRVASTIEAVLRAGGRDFRVSTRPRRIAVRVQPGKRTLTLRLRLSAGKLSTRRVLAIPRT